MEPQVRFGWLTVTKEMEDTPGGTTVYELKVLLLLVTHPPQWGFSFCLTPSEDDEEATHLSEEKWRTINWAELPNDSTRTIVWP